jgi:CheY-like chemotaxis protein
MPPVQARKTILVVEDNYANRIVAKTILERDNYEIVLAENGQIALDMTRVQSFDLILMDIEMPIMDGFDAARAIKSENGPNKNTPIIAVTAYGNKIIHQEALACGMSDMLTKPIRVEQVKAAWARAAGTADVLPAVVNSETADPKPHLEESLILDMSIITPLHEAATPATLALLYQRFFSAAKDFIEDIHQNKLAAERKETAALTQLRKSAHALKGASSNIGFKRVSLIAAELQNASPNDILKLVELLSPTFKISRTELEKLLRHKFSPPASQSYAEVRPCETAAQRAPARSQA